MWNTDKELVEQVWSEARGIHPDVYLMLMQAAHEVCVAYAPVPSSYSAPVSQRYKLAEIEQAKHLWGQLSGGNREEIGADGYSIPVYPLVFAARDLLRPKTSPLSRLR